MEIDTKWIRSLSAVAVLGAFTLASCGGDDNGGGGTPQARSQPSGGPTRLEIKMDEFSFNPKDVQASAGSVTISAPNVGKAEHELVLIKTDRDPGSFPVSAGRVDEEAFESVGEIPDVEAGKTKRATFQLKAGSYAMICNIPAHYQQGMYGSLTVK